jgi:hypothetical protein
MSSPTTTTSAQPLDLSKWRSVPTVLMVLGGLGALAGAFLSTNQFAFSWLLAFMFCLSFCLGGMFLTMVHHLFDASWSIPVRRINEHLACLAPALAALFIPIALLAPKLYKWFTEDPAHDHALKAKLPLFTKPSFYIVAAVSFICWWFWSSRLRYWSLEQDKTGSAECTFKMRMLSSTGIFVFAITFTLAVIMWMKALMHEWFSTMYGVYYFAGSVWMTLATVYVIALILKRQGPLREVMKEKQFYFLGSLLFAFTVFYAYVTFAQYFIIWNANIPEETFWYVVREKGSWWDIGLIIIFGHFFVPFLTLLRIDVKLTAAIMIPLAAWTWLMHFCDMSFNIMPVLHPEGFVLHPLDIACLMFMVGLLAKVFLTSLMRHPIYPQRDPRIAEGLDIYVAPASAAKVSHGGAK